LLDDCSKAASKALGLLNAEFDRLALDSDEFPSSISPLVIRSCIESFRQSLSADSLPSVCSSCGICCESTDINTFSEDDPRLDILKPWSLDKCGYKGGIWNFCPLCYNNISTGKIPKFSGANLINVITCDEYPSVLKDLTFVEESAIARRHPVGAVLKLRPGNCRNATSYYALRGHMIILPQNPGPLLDILPCSNLRFQDTIKVFWVGKCQPSEDDLKPYLRLRKIHVLRALQWLVAHNKNYHDLAINYPLLSSWPDEFVPPQIAANITFLNESDHNEREGYTASLETDNFENDFHAACYDATDIGAVFSSGSLCTDIDGERINHEMQLLHTLTASVENPESSSGADSPGVEMDDSDSDSDVIEDDHIMDYAIDDALPNQQRPVSHGQSYHIRYRSDAQSSPLSNVWGDPLYFTAAFPTLYPTGVGGHLDNRPIKVSLEAMGKWALNHHSRR
jgi:hypothetical protein